MENLPLFILCGNTGCGKSRILRCLDQTGYQVLDLEKIAGHNGSAFGSPIQRKHQLQQREFVKEILLRCSLIENKAPLFTEWKGKKLGSLNIPDFLYSQQITAPKILIERDKDFRIRELMKVYKDVNTNALYKALFSIRKNFDPQHFDAALRALEQKNKFEFIRQLIIYYDGTYEYSRARTNVVLQIKWNSESETEIVGLISQFMQQNHP